MLVVYQRQRFAGKGGKCCKPSAEPSYQQEPHIIRRDQVYEKAYAKTSQYVDDKRCYGKRKRFRPDNKYGCEKT